MTPPPEGGLHATDGHVEESKIRRLEENDRPCGGCLQLRIFVPSSLRWFAAGTFHFDSEMRPLITGPGLKAVL
ncbi:MAG: hypothetical protein ACJ731_08355 [Vicinamibacterales bacterium]